MASLPRSLKPDEVNRLLTSFNASLPSPKRGYAIVRCVLDLGLRANEIAKLQLTDIDWRAGTVTLNYTKARRQDTLPLPVVTGQALADYIQHERPKTTNSAVFVRILVSVGSVSVIICCWECFTTLVPVSPRSSACAWPMWCLMAQPAFICEVRGANNGRCLCGVRRPRKYGHG